MAVAGRREVLVNLIGTAAEEVDDRELLAVPVEGVDVYVTSKAVDGMTLAELAKSQGARGVFLRKITRGATATDIPILADTQLQRGDIVTLVGRTQDIAAATKMLGFPDRATDVADVAFIGAAIAIGALLGAIVYKVGSVPLTLSTSGGALVSGLFFGWLRSVRPTFGRIPSSTVWFMNSVGLNVFIAVVGISSGPGFVAGLQQLGFSLFLWGVFVTTVPLILAMYVGKYLFRFDEAILLGCCAGARTTTAALGMINDRAQSQDSRAWLHRHLRGRKHTADDLGNGPSHVVDIDAKGGRPPVQRITPTSRVGLFGTMTGLLPITGASHG